MNDKIATATGLTGLTRLLVLRIAARPALLTSIHVVKRIMERVKDVRRSVSSRCKKPGLFKTLEGHRDGPLERQFVQNFKD